MSKDGVPKYKALMNPLLRTLRDLGGSGSIDEIRDGVIDHLNMGLVKKGSAASKNPPHGPYSRVILRKPTFFHQSKFSLMKKTVLDTEKLEAVGRQNDVSLLGVFGSYVRGEATRESDVDVIVRFSRRKSLLDHVRIEREMSDVLDRNVDLLTEASISPHLRDRILDEMIVLYDDET